VPVGDNASTAVRPYDVLSSHSPLLGQWTTSLDIVGEPMFSLGPLLNWVLAVPARLSDPAWLALAIGLVDVVAVMLSVALAHRRGGLVLMLLTAVAIAVMAHSLGGEAMHSLWNRSAALLPFTALLFVGWSAACGDYKLLPIAVLLASCVVQCTSPTSPPRSRRWRSRSPGSPWAGAPSLPTRCAAGRWSRSRSAWSPGARP
jgi:hypothetical protein